jgi:hypothetical protein
MFISNSFFGLNGLKLKNLTNKKISQNIISSTAHRKNIFLFLLKSSDDNFNKTGRYINSLPECLLKDINTPDIYSFSWLQRIGKADIFLPEYFLEKDDFYPKNYNNSKNESKFFFSLQKKKRRENFIKPLTLGFKKEEKILSAENFYFKIYTSNKGIGLDEKQNPKNFSMISFFKTDLTNLKISTRLKIFFLIVNIYISYFFGMF